MQVTTDRALKENSQPIADADTSREDMVQKDKAVDRTGGTSREKHITTESEQRAWSIIAAGASVPIGVSAAAAYTTYVSDSERVSITAWIAVAIVGTASVISSAVAARRRVRCVTSNHQRGTSKSKDHDISKSHTVNSDS